MKLWGIPSNGLILRSFYVTLTHIIHARMFAKIEILAVSKQRAEERLLEYIEFVRMQSPNNMVMGVPNAITMRDSPPPDRNCENCSLRDSLGKCTLDNVIRWKGECAYDYTEVVIWGAD